MRTGIDLARLTACGGVGAGLLRGDGWVFLADETGSGTNVAAARRFFGEDRRPSAHRHDRTRDQRLDECVSG